MPPKTGSSNPPSAIAVIAPAAPCAITSFSISMRTRSADRVATPSRAASGRQGRKAFARGNAGEVSGTIGLAGAIGRVHAEKPENAQVVFGDTLTGVADESHTLCEDIG